MQYSKPMIDLVHETRRRVVADMKPGIKLANPEILRELADFYHHCKDTVTKALIKELLFLAGDVWLAQIEDQKIELPKQVTKVYRGQVNLADAPHLKQSGHHKPVRIYRGQVVDY